ncbi:MAG: amino acid permease-associated region [Solirubrobacterales bacterium]|nr:amino acid permease-associated region [Solirubrobacterales bacterium]
MATSAPPSGAVAPQGLERAIGRNMLLVFVVGDVLGAGIYALVGEVGGRVGGAIWTAFAVALLLAVFTAFAYAELVTKYPQAAGAALYVNKAFRRPFLSFMVAFAVMASGITSAATLARAFGGDYLEAFVSLPTVLVGIGFLLVIALINARGIKESIRFNLVLTGIEVAGLLLVVVIAIAAIADGQGDAGRAFDFKEGESVVGAMLGGAALAFFALIGFEDSVNVAEEARDPRRAFPRALFGGLLIAGVIYLTVTVLASMVVPTDVLAASDGPLQTVAGTGPLAVDAKVFSAIALFALANGALINMVMASRLLYGMSNEGILPSVLGGVGTRRTPLLAIAFTTLLGIVLVLTGDLGDLADMTVTLLLIVFIAVNVSVLVLRRDPVGHDHFRTPSWIPVVGIGVCILLLTYRDGEVFLRSAILLGVGALLYLLNVALTGPNGPLDTRRLEAVSHPDVGPATGAGPVQRERRRP